MSVSKLKDGSGWKVYIRFVDWQGKKQVHTKQTFETKRDALNYERDFIQKKSRDIQMNFAKFVEIYLEDIKPRIKLNTFMTKKHIIETKILPYFENKSLAEIDSTDVIQWQNVLLCARDENGKAYAATYLRTVQNQLSAIFNHAHRFYGLPENPSSKAGKMGKAKAKEMLFWTKEEYEKFSDAIKDKPISYYAFQVLYWTGIREGELLSLVKSDFDLIKRKLTISKSYQRINGEDIITSPKTEKSNRVIDMPKFLCDEMEDYFGMFYSLADDTRLFHISKSYLHHEMDRGCKKAGVKRVRVHDIRHSHVAHLISLGFTPVEIAERLGHEGISVTYTYSHLYPSKQKELADRLDAETCWMNWQRERRMMRMKMQNKVQGRLGYNAENKRYGLLVSDLWENSGFHCGECMEVLVGNRWVEARMEMDWNNGGEWYLAGTPYHGDLEYVQARI